MFNKLTHHYWVILTDICCQLEESLQFIFIRANIHRRSGKDIRRTHKNRETDSLDEVINISHAGQCTPLRLINIITGKHSREFNTVLCIINILSSCTQNRNIFLIKEHCQIIRNLPTCTYDNSMRIFKIYDVHDTLKRKVIKIQTITHIIVSAYCLRIIIDHHRTISRLTDRIQSLYTTPVKLNRTAYSICTTTKNYH